MDLRGFEIVEVGPLTATDSVELLASFHHWSPAVAAEVARRSGRNPLTLLEVGRTLTDGQRRGMEKLPDRLPTGSATIRLFRGQIEALSDETRFALLVAALCNEPGQGEVEAACATTGSGEPNWADLERARLLTRRGDRLEFTHPLVPSAVIELADPLSIRRANRGLSLVTTEPTRRTWHRAEACSGADETTALELERLAVSALAVGDSPAAVRAAARAAELSGDTGSAPHRWLLAARSASMAGLDPTVYINRARTGPIEVRAEAIVLEAAAVSLARRAWVLAEGRFDIDHPFGLMPAIAIAVNAHFGPNGHAELFECRRLVQARAAVDLATPVTMGLVVAGRHEEAFEFAKAMYRQSVRDGRILAAAWTATAAGMASLLMGDLPATRRWCTLGLELGQAADVPYVIAQATSQLATVAALRGDRETVATLTDEIDAPPLCDSPTPTLHSRRFASILDELQSGSLDLAVEQLRAFRDVAIPMAEHWPIAYELVEALVRLGRNDEALEVMPLVDAIEAERSLQHGGQIERCRALTAGPENFDHHFLVAIECLEGQHRSLELARTRLCFGERLIATGRNSEALEPLRSALATFDNLRTGRAAGLPEEVDTTHIDPAAAAASGFYGFMSRVDHLSLLDTLAGWDRSLGNDLPVLSWCSLAVTDAAGHESGPHGELARAAVRDSDARVGEIVTAVERAGVLERTAFFVIADHGMEQCDPEVVRPWEDDLTEAGVQHRILGEGLIYLS